MNFDFNRLYLTTDGRIGRQDYWIGVVGLIVISIIIAVIVGAIFGWMSQTTSIVTFIFQVILAYPSYCLMAKRFQDRDKPATYAAIVVGLSILYSLIGLFGITGQPSSPNAFGIVLGLVIFAVFLWVLIELGFLRGTVGPNQYGPDPVAAM